MNLNGINIVKPFGVGVAFKGNHVQLTYVAFDREGKLRTHVTGYEMAPNPTENDRFTEATAHLTDISRIRFFNGDSSCDCVQEIHVSFGRQNKAVSDAAQRRDLSADGKLQIAVEAATTALKEIGAQYSELLVIEARLEQRYAALYSAGEPDAAEAAVDIEARRNVTAMTIAEQLSTVAKFDKPEYRRVMIAMRRSPWPYDKAVAEVLDRKWSEYIAGQKPKEAAELSIAQSNNRWAKGVARNIGALIWNHSLNNTHGRIDMFKVYSILKPVGGVGLLDLSEEQTKHYELKRIELAA